MLFKLFTLFSMAVLTRGASVHETGPSHVSHRYHYGGNSGWDLQKMLGGGSSKTVTVTVTKTSVCKSTTTTAVESAGDTKDLNSQEHCLYLFNKMRKSQNLPLFESATQEQIDCANKAAVYDAQAGYHASFGRMCTGAASQCECMKNVGMNLPNADPNDPLKNCIEAYIAEHTLNMWPELRKGHWLIITNPSFKYVACGTDGNGFYTHNFYT